jgi:hypothetical protein
MNSHDFKFFEEVEYIAPFWNLIVSAMQTEISPGFELKF